MHDDENVRLTAVGRGTEVGELMREYWVPAMLSSELPTPDCDPVRVMLLGEQLIGFRDSSGKPGLIANLCPHRGASMFLGRNEENGLRCVYHGWKFDVSGNCVDMPNEPPESNFKDRVKATAYPCVERAGVVWTYMGTRETPPALPDLEATMLPESDRTLRVMQQQANWLQILEGDIDTSHLGFLHMGALRHEDQPAETFGRYALEHRSPRYQVLETDYGTMYGAYRDASEGHEYWRIAHFLFPFFSMAPGGVLGLTKMVIARVPMDDHHTLNFFWSATDGRQHRPASQAPDERGALLENTTDWFGRFRTAANEGNDYFIDRDAQREREGVIGFTGIIGLLQDQAIVESMGPLADRKVEHLGTSDTMIIRTRQRIAQAAHEHALTGEVPPGVDDPAVYRVRSGGVILERDADWVEATRHLVEAFVEHPELDPSVGANA